jgi:hypothetical protein
MKIEACVTYGLNVHLGRKHIALTAKDEIHCGFLVRLLQLSPRVRRRLWILPDDSELEGNAVCPDG